MAKNQINSRNYELFTNNMNSGMYIVHVQSHHRSKMMKLCFVKP
jgi:hypothetical protein